MVFDAKGIPDVLSARLDSSFDTLPRPVCGLPEK
jgi:hypothetical protein